MNKFPNLSDFDLFDKKVKSKKSIEINTWF